MIDGLPPLPPGMRTASADDRQAYRAALGFEQILLGQLAQEIVPAGDGPYAAAMQDAFTGGLVAAGGIGLAASIYPALRKEGA